MADKLFSNVIYSDLTNQQKEFVNEASKPNRSIFLTGCAGAGKTLLATMATIKLNEKNQHIKFLVYTKMLEKFVRDYFRDTDHVNVDLEEQISRFHVPRTNRIKLWSKIKKLDLGDIENNATKLAEELGINQQYDCILVDECQDFQRPMVETVKALSKNQIWLGDATQQIFGHGMSKENEGFSSLHNDSDYERFHLDTNFRNPLTVAILAQHFITVNDFDTDSLKEKVKNFITPIANNQTATSAARNQPNIFIEASDADNQYDAIADRIKAIQSKKATGSSNQIVITHVHSRNLYRIKKALEKRGIHGELAKKRIGKDMEDNFDFKDPDLILFGTVHSLKGLEFDYLIFPDTEESETDFNHLFEEGEDDNSYQIGYKLTAKQKKSIINNTLFMLFTRAKKRIICSYINKNESIVYRELPRGVENRKDHYRFIKAGEKVVDQTDHEVEEKVKTIKDNLNEDNWPVQRKKSVKELKKNIKEVTADDLPF